MDGGIWGAGGSRRRVNTGLFFTLAVLHERLLMHCCCCTLRYALCAGGLWLQPTEAEVQFILDAISDYLTVKVCGGGGAVRCGAVRCGAVVVLVCVWGGRVHGRIVLDGAEALRAVVLLVLLPQVRRSDVLSAWSGIRPLALDPNAAGEWVGGWMKE